MPRITWRSFQRGLWLNGGPDSIPDEALRRATGIDQIKEGVVRSARGITTLQAQGANSIVRFGDLIFTGQGVNIRRNGSIVDTTQDGTRLTFLRQPPQVGKDDYLFVAGGGHLVKIDASGAVTEWGIEPPDEGAVAEEYNVYKSNLIDSMNDDTGWSLIPAGSDGTLTDSTAAGDSPTVHSTANTNSLKLITGDDIVTQIKLSVTEDLNFFSPGVKSYDQDYIEWWVRIDDIDELSRLELAFSLGDDNFDDDFYIRRIEKDEFAPPDQIDPDQDGFANDQLTQTEQREIVSGRPGTQIRNIERRARTHISKRSTSWILLKLPKATFDRSGDDPDLNWADVRGVRISVVKNGTATRPVTVWMGDLRLRGGFGLIGAYQYQFTFKNSVTGSRSNGVADADGILIPLKVITPDGTGVVNRQRIRLTDIPVATDPQVDKVEIWRTVGNGELYFKVDEVNNGTTTYNDDIVDFRQLASGDHFLESELPPTLDIEELPTDNNPPEDTWDFVAAMTYRGRTWFCGDGLNQVYYTGAGRPESVGDGGFVNVGSTDDPPTAIIVWNDAVYAFTSRRVFRISGEDEPFQTVEVFGVPGTVQPYTVVSTPFGIVYQAIDGPRIFNGTTSELAATEAIGIVFRGRDVENVTAFDGISATYTKDAWYCCDGAQILVLDMRSGAWRHFSIAADTIYAEGDNEDIILAIGLDTGLVTTLEDPNATGSIVFEVQTYAQRTGIDIEGFVRRLYFDIDTQGSDVLPTLLVDNQVITIPELNTPSRQMVEYTTNARGKLVAVNLLAGVTTEEIKLYGIECDIYVPEGSGDRSIRPRSEQ